MVSGVEPGRLPAGNLLTAVQRRDVAEAAEQAPQYALGLGIHERDREHPLACRPQDPVLRDVGGELVVLDLQRQWESMMPTQLLAFPQPATEHLGTLLDEDVPGKQALTDRTFRLPPQRLGNNRNKVRGLGHRHRLRPPGGRVPGVPHQEQQPGDGDLGLDVYFDAADPGRADLPGGTDLPGSRVVRGWRSGDHAGADQRSSLFRREQPLNAWPQLVKFDGSHHSAGAAAMALRRLVRP